MDSWIEPDIAYNRYDLKYRNTRASDYIHDECINEPIDASYIPGDTAIHNKVDFLILQGVVLTHRNGYEARIADMRRALAIASPTLCVFPY